MPASQPALALPLLPRKAVWVDWDGGELSSDAGWLLLALADQQLGLTRRMAAAITDPRVPDQVKHPLPGRGESSRPDCRSSCFGGSGRFRRASRNEACAGHPRLRPGTVFEECELSVPLCRHSSG